MDKKHDEDKIVFEKYGIEFTDDDFEGVDQETLVQCKRKLNTLLKKIEQESNKGGVNQWQKIKQLVIKKLMKY